MSDIIYPVGYYYGDAPTQEIERMYEIFSSLIIILADLFTNQNNILLLMVNQFLYSK
jgi:hypothetical protein